MITYKLFVIIKEKKEEMITMEIMMTFKCNTAYKLADFGNEEYYIIREIDGVILKFSPETFKYLGDEGIRFIPKSVRAGMKEEMHERYPELYAKWHDEVVKTETKNEELDMQMMMNLFKEMNAQNMEMIRNMNNPYEEAIVKGIIEKGSDVTTDQLRDRALQKVDTYIQKTYGLLPKTIEVKTATTKKVMQGLFHKQFEKILQLVGLNIPTMLVGPAGSGKNHTLEQVAEALELEFYFSNAITQEYKLTGFIDANGMYQETQFYKAFKNGGLFFLDEMDASIPEVLIILNSAIANGYFDFPNGKVDAHEDFRVVSAGNTMGTGANAEYTGRNRLDAATLDRFAIIEFGYDSEIEKQLASTPELYEFIVDLRHTIDGMDLKYVVSMRATINASKLDGLLDKQDIIKSVILKGLPKDEVKMVYGNMTHDRNEWARALSVVAK